MKKYLFITIIGLLFIGCSTDVKKTYVKNETASTEVINNDKFKIIYENDGNNYQIVYDKDTGVEYVVSNSLYNRGNFTMLVNADGTPKIHQPK